MARDQEESKFEDTVQFQMHFLSYAEERIFKVVLNLNVITPLLCICTEIKSQEDKSTAGHDIRLKEPLEGSNLKRCTGSKLWDFLTV